MIKNTYALKELQFFSKHFHGKYMRIKFSQLYKFIKLLFLPVLPPKKIGENCSGLKKTHKLMIIRAV